MKAWRRLLVLSGVLVNKLTFPPTFNNSWRMLLLLLRIVNAVRVR